MNLAPLLSRGRIRRWTVVSSALVALTGSTLWSLERRWLGVLTREDGLVESTTALAFLVAAGLFLRLATRGGRWRPLWSTALALASVFVAGEELSWGQRLFTAAEPELNLHELGVMPSNLRAVALIGVATACHAMPLAHRFSGPARAWAERLELPVFPLFAAPAVALAIAYLLAPRVTGVVASELDEIGELLLGMAALAFAAVHSTAPAPSPSRSASLTAAGPER